MSLIKTIPPAPLCFSCGNLLPESDYDLFHELIFKMTNTKEFGVNESQKIILDGKVEEYKLSRSYPRDCCRIMFLGDPIEYRRKMALYENDVDYESIHLK